MWADNETRVDPVGVDFLVMHFLILDDEWPAARDRNEARLPRRRKR